MKNLLFLLLFFPLFVGAQTSVDRFKVLSKNFYITDRDGDSYMLYHKQHETETSVINPQLTVSKDGTLTLNLWSGNNTNNTNVYDFRQISFDLNGRKYRTPYVHEDEVISGEYEFSNGQIVKFEQIIFDSDISLVLTKQIVDFHLNNKSKHIFYNLISQDKVFSSLLGYREVVVLVDSWELYQLWNKIGSETARDLISNH